VGEGHDHRLPGIESQVHTSGSKVNVGLTPQRGRSDNHRSSTVSTARRYAIARYMLSPCVCPSVCRSVSLSVWYRNGLLMVIAFHTGRPPKLTAPETISRSRGIQQ